MNTSSDFDRIASAWLAEGPVELADRVFEAAFEEVQQTRQRRVSRAPWRPSKMTPTFKLVAAAAAVLAVLAAGTLFLNRGGGPLVGATPPPSPTAAPPTPAPTATPAPRPVLLPDYEDVSPEGALLPAGAYRTEWIDPPATAQLECCFEMLNHGPRLLVLGENGLARYVVITDPDQVIDPATGDPAPLPGDLMAWLLDHPGLDVRAPSNVSVGGLTGREVEGAPREDAEYDVNGQLHLTPETFLTADLRFRFIVLDAPDGPLMIHVLARSDVFDEFAPKAQAVLDGLAFGD
jgi:hypothetical protein